MGTGKKARDRRVVWQWSFKRYRHDIQAINAMVERAEAVAAGKRALKKDRFVRIADAAPAVDWDLVKRAQNLAGLKGYVTTSTPRSSSATTWSPPTTTSTRSNAPSG